MRFSVDQRTNSIIASGTTGDLSVVEAILLRLDETDIRKRKSTVYRLKNAPAADVATAINEYLANEIDVEQITTELMSPFEQIERRVVVVAETVSNSLIISATPEYYEEIMALIEELDARPPMVMIQVLIAEIQLGDTDEFGVEFGLQDSALFDRGLLENIQRSTNTRTVIDAGGGSTTFTDQIIDTATLSPGFNFGNPGVGLGSAGSDSSLATAGRVAGQALSKFGVSRTSSDAGVGGLAFSASSKSGSMPLRTLEELRRLEGITPTPNMVLNTPALPPLF